MKDRTTTSRHFVWAGADTWIDDTGVHSRYSTTIRASREAVFDYVSDVMRHPEWAANRMTVTPLTTGPARVGSRYRTVASQAGREWQSTVEITRYDRPSVFEFIAIGGATQEPADRPHRHTFTLRDVAGGTELELHRHSRGLDRRPFVWRVILAVAATPVGQWLVNRLARNIALGQENIKRSVERSATP